MIDNSLDGFRLRRGDNVSPLRDDEAQETMAHATPTKEKKRKSNGELTNYSLQGNCRDCHMKTSYVCSICERIRILDPERHPKKSWFCHRKTNRPCLQQHIFNKH